MNTDEFRWRSIDDLNIYGKYWTPDKDVKAVVCLVHGMGEHCGRYAHVAEYLTHGGIAVVAYDQRGHGKSEGKRGHTPSYDHLLQGVENLIYKGRELFPETPVILYGHSMGGNLALNYALRKNDRLNGVIASSPWLRLAFEPPAFQVRLARFMRRIYPAFSQATRLDTKAISRIPEEVKKYEQDPLVHDRITAMMFTEVYEAGLWALDHAEELEIPLLIYHGTADRITSYQASQEFASKAKGDVTLKLFEGAFHETHNDLCRDEVLTLIKSWIEEHI
ncbi:MAG: lysophospholipase [Chitinophagales bacterium]|nr:MAG: lysophospholipase [Chitinophagales bacterium]